MRCYPFCSGAFFAVAWWIFIDTAVVARHALPASHSFARQDTAGNRSALCWETRATAGQGSNATQGKDDGNFSELFAGGNATMPTTTWRVTEGNNSVVCQRVFLPDNEGRVLGRHFFPGALATLAFFMVAASPFAVLRAALRGAELGGGPFFPGSGALTSDEDESEGDDFNAAFAFDDGTAACGACTQTQCARAWLFASFTLHFASVMYGVVFATNGDGTWVDGAVTAQAAAIFAGSLLWTAAKLGRKCSCKWRTARRWCCFLRTPGQLGTVKKTQGKRKTKLHGYSLLEKAEKFAFHKEKTGK